MRKINRVPVSPLYSREALSLVRKKKNCEGASPYKLNNNLRNAPATLSRKYKIINIVLSYRVERREVGGAWGSGRRDGNSRITCEAGEIKQKTNKKKKRIPIAHSGEKDSFLRDCYTIVLRYFFETAHGGAPG